MATTPQAFYCLWQQEGIREKLFELLSKEDICHVRLANSACCNLVTKRLFLRTNLTFSASTFTRQSRIQALSRIGHHIEHLTFYFPGQEISFLYTPHTSMASVLSRPKFANTGLGEILTQQYPPLFHAASNVPSFINAMKHVPNMRHLTIKTPGQNAKERYRRDIVDYALISLRISLERAPLLKLAKLSLSAVHPSAFNYLRHVPGFGCTPSAGRRWQQIRKLQISVESWDFYGPSPGLDHLKMLDDYIRNFADSVEKFSFTWLGRKGPCPVSLAADPLFAPPRSSQKLFNEVTSPMSPLPPPPARRPIRFRRLRYLSVRNATMNAPQVAELVASHQRCVREFDFDNVVLINGGSWDDALAPLMDHASRSDHWVRQSTGSITDVAPGGFPANTMMPPSSPEAAATPGLQEEFSAQSAAVAAVSEELFNIDLNGGADEDEDLGAEYAQRWVNGEFDDSESGGAALNPDLDSDLEAARQASLLPATKLKKRRVTKRRKRRKQHNPDGGNTTTTEQEDCYQAQPQPQPQPQSNHSSPFRFHRRQQKSEDSIREEQWPQQQQQQQQPRQASPPMPEPIGLRSPMTPPPKLAQYVRSPLFGELDRTPSRTPSRASSNRSGGPSSSSTPRRLFGEVLDRSPSTPPSLISPSSSRPPMSRRGLSSRGGGGGASVTSPSASLLFGEITAVPELSRSPIDDSASATSDDYFRPVTPVTYYGGNGNNTNNSGYYGYDPNERGSNTGTGSFVRTRELSSLLNSCHHHYEHLREELAAADPHHQHYNSDHDSNSGSSSADDKITISAPILDTKPSMPALLLQPTVYNPMCGGGGAAALAAEPCSEITAVQRDIEAEEAQRRIAEDPALRSSMLRKAKATVLSKLSEHFPRSEAHTTTNNNNYNNNFMNTNNSNNNNGGGRTNTPLGRKLSRKDSMAGAAAAMRFRFGGGARNNSNNLNSSNNNASVVSTLTSMDVPILFSRA
ncbi:hypothetical protein PG985_015841 [Apiospora marii]|uniref:uncharacterized protein n=1 Tax=Apiospora marii TaxID=335849 RepID=UPI00312F88CB